MQAIIAQHVRISILWQLPQVHNLHFFAANVCSSGSLRTPVCRWLSSPCSPSKCALTHLHVPYCSTVCAGNGGRLHCSGHIARVRVRGQDALAPRGHHGSLLRLPGTQGAPTCLYACHVVSYFQRRNSPLQPRPDLSRRSRCAGDRGAGCISCGDSLRCRVAGITVGDRRRGDPCNIFFRHSHRPVYMRMLPHPGWHCCSSHA